MSFPDLIRGEEELLKRLLLVSQRQLEIVRAGDGALLLQHLGKRQQLWNEFELLEQQLAPHKGLPPEHRVWDSAEERQQTEATLNRCKELMAEILTNDETSLVLAAEQKNEAAEQLRRIQQGGSAAVAYRRQSLG